MSYIYIYICPHAYTHIHICVRTYLRAEAAVGGGEEGVEEVEAVLGHAAPSLLGDLLGGVGVLWGWFRFGLVVWWFLGGRGLRVLVGRRCWVRSGVYVYIHI